MPKKSKPTGKPRVRVSPCKLDMTFDEFMAKVVLVPNPRTQKPSVK